MNYMSSKWSLTVLASLLVIFSGCSKSAMESSLELFEPDLKAVSLQSGVTDGLITMHADRWAVAYVKDTKSGTLLKDSSGVPLMLNGPGTAGLMAGWLTLEKTNDNQLKMNLRENFSNQARDFIIGISTDGNRKEEMHIIQTRAAGYELVKKDIREIDTSRKSYLSTEGCKNITLVNSTDQEKKMSTDEVFSHVQYSSTFTSDDYGAFDWLAANDSLIFMDDLLMDGSIIWSDQVVYRAGTNLVPYYEKGGAEGTLTLRPYSTVQVSGKMQYVERTCKYTFTIKNKSSGNQFLITGTWKQKVPVIPHLRFE